MSNIDKQALREELSNPAIGSKDHLRKLALSLLDELDVKEEQRANWFQMAQKLGEDLDAAERHIAETDQRNAELTTRIELMDRRIAELERSETQLINERDAAESALADMYQAATGERPEWSNMFGFADAVDVVEERLATLEANQSQTTPTGIQLITEAIGAHGYIVGCLLQGRPDLALEESRKWVSAFGQAGEIVSAQDAADIKVKGE
ncbi:ead/Ea22-like family protein [Salmonella enterica]|nr:ead/Ea22-like family protein [Salmonella enterica subsp. diarizonae]EED9727804.1 ead/Ea22-like family protein [Salmonella enterica subsp. diarizonae]EEE6681831.1 ead/Ea22-like family protein [Salmonella enterica subsp. diarizonae]EEG1622735.1 ead/Ea22-like family protein [Salmonella enterica subsp. diarizonae]EKR9886761.1 ead/Ea22-like family protein [Salmonella enterica]